MEEKLYGKFLKCEFQLYFVAFLGHTVSKEGLRVDPTKIEVDRGWRRPTLAIEIRSFMELGSYYM